MIRIHDDAASDLAAIRLVDRRAFGRLTALLEQLRSDPRWLQRLLDHGYGEDRSGSVGVKKWGSAWRANAPLWRLRAWELESDGIAYRLIYVYYWRDKTINVLAVVRRDKSFDYDDPTNPLRSRILGRCRSDFPGA